MPGEGVILVLVIVLFDSIIIAPGKQGARLQTQDTRHKAVGDKQDTRLQTQEARQKGFEILDWRFSIEIASSGIKSTHYSAMG